MISVMDFNTDSCLLRQVGLLINLDISIFAWQFCMSGSLFALWLVPEGGPDSCDEPSLGATATSTNPGGPVFPAPSAWLYFIPPCLSVCFASLGR